jgi:hypothetical protein
MSLRSPNPDPDLRAELESLRAEIDLLRSQVERASEAPQIALDHALGQHSILGLRWFGTLMYVALYPIYAVVRLARTITQPRRHFSMWENVYAASFTWVYLNGKERRLLTRFVRFIPTFLRIRAQLRQE